MFAFFNVGNGIGSFIAGSAYERFHSYEPAFLVFGAMLVVTCLLILPLGPYPFPARGRALAPAQG
jgi:predicted MFS family arabinose efflux permease